MRIFIDIGHPAHVHYFRNFIRIMLDKGHTFFVSARERSIIHYLLDHYEIPFYNRGKGKNGVIGKVWYMFHADLKLYKQALRFKPDIFLSFASPYAAQVSFLTRRPHIVLDDTEHARFGHFFYKPFSDVFLNPQCFQKNFGKKQIRFRSFTELFYLHSNYYSPGTNIFKLLNLNSRDRFVLLRFVSWEANHDIGHNGMDIPLKKNIITFLINKGFKVFISNEAGFIDNYFNPYLIKIPPELMHDVLGACSLFITESGTMASEAVILGTPVVYVNSLPLMGYLSEQKNAGLLFHYQNSIGVFEKIKELIAFPELKSSVIPLQNKLLINKINPTLFLSWFIENYPGSAQIMYDNPDFQDQFI